MNRLSFSPLFTRFSRKKTAAAVLLVVSVFFSSFLPAAEPPPEYAAIEPLASKSLLLSACLADGRMVVVGERGHILYSDDKGSSWTQANVQTIATLTGVYFHDKNLGWAVGHDAVILKTADGGKTWSRVYSAPEEERPLLDVWFKDAEQGVAVGAYGLFMTTEDGGLNWSENPIGEEDWHLNQIRRSDSGRLYIAGEAGNICRSDDNGQTWTVLPSPYAGSFFGVLPLEGDTVLVFGLRGHLYRSEDAGDNWQPIESHTQAMLTGGARMPDGRLVVVGLSGTVLVSDDNGKSFSLLQQPDRMAIMSALPVEGGKVLLIGDGGTKELSIAVKE
ncbi:MAG: YCF48-related protein [Thermodesulfobacteriota bacterium]